MKKLIFVFLVSLLFSECTKLFIAPTDICIDNSEFLQSSIVHPKGEAFQSILDK